MTFIKMALYFEFFEIAAGEAVNGDRYLRIITEFLWPKLRKVLLENIFQQDNAALCKGYI